MDSIIILSITVLGFLSFLLTNWLTPRLIKRLYDVGLVAPDINKRNVVMIPSMGGFSIIMSLTVMIVLIIAVLPLFTQPIAIALSGILVGALAGCLDQLITLNRLQHLVACSLASIPVLALDLSLSTELFGFTFTFPRFIFMFLMVIFVTGITQLSHTLEGLNGVGVGLQVIILSTFTFLILLRGGPWEAYALSFVMLGCCLAFLRYNKYPSSTFTGDVGFLGLGAGLAYLAIIANLHIFLFIVYIPHLTDFLIKIVNRLPRKADYPPHVSSDGKLSFPDSPVFSLLRALAELPADESTIVKRLWIIEVIFCFIAALLVLAGHI